MIRAVIFDFNRTLYDPDTKELIGGASELLASLKSRGFKLALLSCPDMPVEERKEEIDMLGINKYFDKIVVAESKGASIIKQLLTALGSSPKETVVVGDRPTSEIKLGNEVGCVTIRLRKGKFASVVPTSKLEEANYCIDELKEVLNIIEAINRNG